MDNLNSYYDPALKNARLARLREYDGFSFHKLDLADESGMQTLFGAHEFPQVVHLAAQGPECAIRLRRRNSTYRATSPG